MSEPHLATLRRAAEAVEARGAIACEDFFVHFVSEGMVSADYVGLRPADGGGFEVYYAERGERRVLETTTDTERAVAVFVEEVLLQARSRGRGLGR